MANIEEKTENLVKKTITDLGYSLYDVMYVKEGKDFYLKIFIDSKNGISLEDCENVNNAITDMLDEANFIKDQYFLEISSPGIERVLRKDEHFKENIGCKVLIKLYKLVENTKELRGTLKDFNKEDIIITDENNKEIIIKRNNIAQIKTVYNWEK